MTENEARLAKIRSLETELEELTEELDVFEERHGDILAQLVDMEARQFDLIRMIEELEDMAYDDAEGPCPF